MYIYSLELEVLPWYNLSYIYHFICSKPQTFRLHLIRSSLQKRTYILFYHLYLQQKKLWMQNPRKNGKKICQLKSSDCQQKLVILKTFGLEYSLPCLTGGFEIHVNYTGQYIGQLVQWTYLLASKSPEPQILSGITLNRQRMVLLAFTIVC